MTYQLPEKLKNMEPYQPITGKFAVRLDANESFLIPAQSAIHLLLILPEKTDCTDWKKSASAPVFLLPPQLALQDGYAYSAVRLDANESFLSLPDEIRHEIGVLVSRIDFNR